ncbi:MAG: 5-methylcytosine-specific restriction endonuclease system specificity protein McrC [Peptostreptococcaceae bacterium]
MITENGIRIQNIYYMLSYAYLDLKQLGFSNLKIEEFENSLDLLSEILIKLVSKQIKNGLCGEYLNKTELLSGVSGRINISKSIKENSFINKKIVCEYNEFSINNNFNQIIKTTLKIIVRDKNILNNKKKVINRLLLNFYNVDDKNIYQLDFKIKRNRIYKNYDNIINICYLIKNGLIMCEEYGNLRVRTYLDEQSIYRLYEKFILCYYKKHLPKNTYDVSSKKIKWNEDNNNIEFLPHMITDVYILNKINNKRLIIDTKFYKNIMKSNYERKKFNSSNLYQIFTYVKNEECNVNGEVSGILLYAKTNLEKIPQKIYSLGKNNIYLKTLDLDKEFFEITKKLDSIIKILD